MNKENDLSSTATADTNTNEKRKFFESLKKAETGAIQKLATQISFGARRAASNAKLSPEDAEELVNDALVITINNIRQGKFQFQNFTPAAYANGVLRKLIANRLRTKKLNTSPLSGTENIVDFSPEQYLEKKEREQYIGKLLTQLGEGCQKLLKLKYFENFKDKEIISLGLTSFSSINSLKSKRSLCLKRLIALAQEQ